MTSKVTNFIKQYFFMLALAATFIGFSAFKFTEVKRSTLWFDIQLGSNPDLMDQTNQTVTTESQNDPEPTGADDECTLDNSIRPCAIQLTLNPGVDPEDLENKTVHEILEVDESASFDGYAYRDEE